MKKLRIPNKEVILRLKEVLSAMEVKGYNIFRVRAYQNALSILDNLTVSIYDIWENGELPSIPGLGPALIAHLNELFRTGTVAEWASAMEDLPQGMFSLIGIRGIGAKKAYKLAVAFKLGDRATAVDILKEKALTHKVQELEGFGEKSEQDILEAVEQLKMTKNEKPRMLLTKAESIVERVVAYMKQLDCVTHIEAAGSFRRRNATVGDLDFPVATTDAIQTLDHFCKFPEIDEILVRGDKKISAVLKNEIQIDMRVCPPEIYGAMLQYFTGSKQHNVVLRNFALSKGLSLSEYGIKEGDKLLEYSTEKEFYAKLGLAYIPPEMRQGGNEIELARKVKEFDLIELKDIKGDLHLHTTDSDGLNSLEEMVTFAKRLGYEYIGITDHAPSVTSRGYEEVAKIIQDKKAQIAQINAQDPKFKIFYGYEVNILADATLGLPNDLLKELDFCIASIHTAFNQDTEQLTHRFISALENPYVTMIGHPSGRLLNERDPVDPNWHKVFQCARDHGKIMEINAQPDRLDLTDDLVKEAISWGVALMINTDAHVTVQYHNIKYGIDIARRAGLHKTQILNTLSLPEFEKKILRG